MTDSSIKQWVAVELTRLGERERPEDLLDFLTKEVGDDLEVFIPSKTYIRRGSRMTICLMEGYAFIEAGKSAGFYMDLESLPYIAKTLTKDEAAGRFLLYISDTEVEELKAKLAKETSNEIQKNDLVEIIEGVYKNLDGVVIDFNPHTSYAMIQISGLTSLDTIVELPLQFLERRDDA